MKIALAFYGQPRFICPKTFDSVKEHFLDKYDCDVYAHFWFSDDPFIVHETAPWSGLGPIKFSQDTIELFKVFYKPISIRLDPPLIENTSLFEKYTNAISTRSPYLITSSYTSRKYVYELIQNPEQYDFIIWMRSDTVYVRTPDFLSLDKLSIYRFIQDTKRILYNDGFLVSPPAYAKEVFSMIDVFDTIYEKGTFFNSEELFTSAFKYLELEPVCKTLTVNEFNMGFLRSPSRVSYCQ
jgi:hypothetical protein